MSLKFIHCSDLHLGRQRLEGKLPESDLADALRYIVAYTINSKADGLLIAGDLFDSPMIQPPHLQIAIKCLQPLKDQGIPVFAIEGNHDRPSLTSDTTTWVRYLNNQEYLTLLSIPFTAAGPQISEWDPQTRFGSFIVYKGIRIIGAGYLGAGTVRRLKAIGEIFQAMAAGDAQPTIMLLHAGPEYLVHEGGGYEQESLEFLKSFVDYLALGHVHKQINYHNWAINPGTAENIRIEEAAYDKRSGVVIPRGMAEILINFNDPETKIESRILPVPRRPVQTISFDCSNLSERNIAPKIRESLLKQIRLIGTTPETVLRIDLRGELNFARAGLDPLELGNFLEKTLPVKAVEIILSNLNQPAAQDAAKAEVSGQPRENLERQAISQLLHDTPLAELEDFHLNALVELFMTLKEDVRNQLPGEEILDKLNRHPVVASLAQAYFEKREKESLLFPEVAAADQR